MPTSWGLGGAKDHFPDEWPNFVRIGPQAGYQEYDSSRLIYFGQAPASLPLAGQITGHLSHQDSPGAHSGAIYPVFNGTAAEQTFGTIPSGSSAALSLNTAARGLGAHWFEARTSTGLSKGGGFYIVARDTAGRPDPTLPGNAFDSDDTGYRIARLMGTGGIRVSMQRNYVDDISVLDPLNYASYAAGQVNTLIDYWAHNDPDRWGAQGAPIIVNYPSYSPSTVNFVASLNALMAALPSTQHVYVLGENEPGLEDIGATDWGDDFLDMVAKIATSPYASRLHPIGPSTVSVTEKNIRGIREHLSNPAVKAALAMLGMHTYNSNPSWRGTRDSAERVIAMRNDLGLNDRPYYDDEMGDEAEDYAAGMYGHQCARTMNLFHWHVISGGAPESLIYYRNYDGGNTDYRGYLSSFGGVPSPTVAALMEQGAQLRGTVPYSHLADGPARLTYPGGGDLGNEMLSAYTARRGDGTGTTHIMAAVPISSSLVHRYVVTREGGGSLPSTLKVRKWDGNERGDFPVVGGVLTIPGQGNGGTDPLGQWVELPADVVLTPATSGGCVAKA